MDINNFYEFLIYIIPGFLAREIQNSVHPGKKRSDFENIALSMLYSIIIYLTVNFIINGFTFSNFTLAKSFANKSINYIIYLLLGGILLGFIMAYESDVRALLGRLRLLNWIIPKNKNSAWEEINKRDNQDWAVVFLKDGSIYEGYIGFCRSDPDKEEQDFILENAKRVDENLNVSYSVTGIGVYLNTRDVIRVEFIKGMEKEI